MGSLGSFSDGGFIIKASDSYQLPQVNLLFSSSCFIYTGREDVMAKLRKNANNVAMVNFN